MCVSVSALKEAMVHVCVFVYLSLSSRGKEGLASWCLI